MKMNKLHTYIASLLELCGAEIKSKIKEGPQGSPWWVNLP
jgi:hypothetical protein